MRTTIFTRFAALAVAALLLATAGTAVAQEPLTLEQAVTTALEKSPARKAALFERRAAGAGIKEARASLLPQIDFSEGVQRGNDPVFVFGSKLRQQRFGAPDFALDALNTPTPFSNWATRFGGTWNLFDSGASWLRVRQARRMDEAAQRNLDRTDQQLVLRVVDDYVGLLLAVKQQQVAEDALKTAQSVLERARNNVEAGMAVQSDLLSAQVNQASREEGLIRARNAVALARAQLNHDMGVPADASYAPAELLAEKPLPAVTLEDALKQALLRRPDLQGIALEKQIQSDSVRAAKAAFGPRVNAFAGWELDNPRFAGGGGNNWMAGVEVRLQLFDGGSRLARLEREKALDQRVEALRENAISGVELEVRKAYLDLDAARQQLAVARAAVEQARESLRITQNRYDAGLNTITDLLRVDEANVRAQADYWGAVYGVQTSYVALELATGTLGPNSPVVKP